MMALLSLQQVNAAQTIHYDSKHALGVKTALAALAYGSYLYFHQPEMPVIPDAATTNIKAIIFDMDGVLSSTNKLRAFQEVGISSTLWPIVTNLQIPSEKLLFDALAGVPALSTATSYNKGRRMPQIMIDWQSNTQSISKIQAAVEAYLATSLEPESIKNWALQTVKMMTDPASFIATRQTIADNVRFLHELKEKGYKVYILSNWDANSFSLFTKSFPEIFQHNGTDTFDGIIISGNVGMVKPQLSIFQTCLTTFNLQPQTSMFIDDEPANIHAAQAIGLRTVQSDPSDSQKLRQQVLQLLKS